MVGSIPIGGGEMQAQSVWGGHHYAYVSYVRRGRFPSSAQEVEVISTRKEQKGWKDRADTFAKVKFVESGAIREVNVRNLYDFWDSYQDEKEHRRAEQERKEAERRAVAVKAERERIAKAERGRKIAEQLAYKLAVDTSVVTYNVYADNVSINAQDLEFLIA